MCWVSAVALSETLYRHIHHTYTGLKEAGARGSYPTGRTLPFKTSGARTDKGYWLLLDSLLATGQLLACQLLATCQLLACKLLDCQLLPSSY